MKPVLLLVPDRDAPLRLRRDVELCPAGAICADTGYSSVIVVNDGGSGTVQRLREALALRERRRDLRVGVLTWLEAQPGGAAIAPGMPLSVFLGELGPELKVELKNQVLSVEYQV
jgi:hypothetical protein